MECDVILVIVAQPEPDRQSYELGQASGAATARDRHKLLSLPEIDLLAHCYLQHISLSVQIPCASSFKQGWHDGYVGVMEGLL
jgi:hypothetical protein